jgi:hypothetical protein
VITLFVFLILTGEASCQRPRGEQLARNEEILRLIEKLEEVAEPDVGYMATMSGSGFLPLGTSEVGMVLLGQKPPASSDVMREIVKRGAAAVPALIAHLVDGRPTKITITRGSAIIGIFFGAEFDVNRETAERSKYSVDGGLSKGQADLDSYTVLVGDLCFVALGQIVNRRFSAVRYQPTGLIIINSPVRSGSLRNKIRETWGDLTPARHVDSLVRDYEQSDGVDRMEGACLRLFYYYPDVLDGLILKEREQPRFDGFGARTLIREKLDPEAVAEEKKARLDAIAPRRVDGDGGGILAVLFGDNGKIVVRLSLLSAFVLVMVVALRNLGVKRGLRLGIVWQVGTLVILISLWTGLTGLIVVSGGETEALLATRFGSAGRQDAFRYLNGILVVLWAVYSASVAIAIAAAWCRRGDVLGVLLVGPVIGLAIGLLGQTWADPNWYQVVAIWTIGWLASLIVAGGYWVIRR